MKLKRIMIAAPKSGSGKTTITCALLKALKNRGEQVVSFKCGPDYIDPLFHEQALSIPSKNLDTFFSGEEATRELFLKHRMENEFAVIEGVMGLFDGLGGIREEGSSYHLAKVTDTPIVLVLDAKGMGRSVVPFIAGFLAYDKEHLIRGVILNKMSKSYYEIIKPVIEAELKIKVLGYFPDQKQVQIKSRHLGLLLPDELPDIRGQLQALSEKMEQTVSVEGIKQLAEQASEIDCVTAVRNETVQKPAFTAGEETAHKPAVVSAARRESSQAPVIAVARDEAFCFYYEDNLCLLEENGASIKYFSPLQDEKLPDCCSALLIGGGYPELYADGLSKNICMREEIKHAFLDGMPVVAECGGFLYLQEALIDQKGTKHEMVGIVPAICTYKGSSVRFGYIEIREKQSYFLPEGTTIKGHEFHYFDSTDNGESCIAIKPVTGRRYSCVMEGANYWLGFPHLYYPSNPAFAEHFVKVARDYSNSGKSNS